MQSERKKRRKKFPKSKRKKTLKMDRIISRNIFTLPSAYTSFYPLHIFGKFFGFAIFTINVKNFTTKFHFHDGIFLVVAIVTNGYVNWCYWIVFTKSGGLQSTVKFQSSVSVSTPLVIFGQYLAYTAIMVLSVVKRDDLCLILRKMKKIDRDLEEFRIKFDYLREMNFIMKIVLFVIATIITLTFLILISENIHEMKIDYRLNVYFFWILNCGAILLLCFIFTLVGVRKRFHGVNRCVE